VTELLDRAIAAVRGLDEAEQDRIAETMLGLAGLDQPEDIDPEHMADVLQGLEEAERGDFVTDEQMSATLARFGR
jgi:hypothetical protein